MPSLKTRRRHQQARGLHHADAIDVVVHVFWTMTCMIIVTSIILQLFTAMELQTLPAFQSDGCKLLAL
jgi:hypothetical protein